MSSSQNEKKNSDVEMGEANPVLQIPAIHEATTTFVAGFLSFKERLSRRSAGKETSRSSAEMSAIPSSSALSISAKGNKSQSDAAPLIGTDTAPVQVPEGFLRLVPLRCPKVAKEWHCNRDRHKEEMCQSSYRLIDGMISNCGSEVERLTEGLAESREALKRIEATLKSTEDAHTGETS
ncbi:hypothetical protein F2Q68_00004670 [Brassica cretica]|uniref:Uncharacterized protein n=1 Tax=Brassica cretica TaxID=69181 RepID=A0A8S9JE92_BRACR|nr:hypothetical protein F2Q68_00004670 [Brassica cretica]